MSQKSFNKKIIIIQNISDIVYDTEIYEHYRNKLTPTLHLRQLKISNSPQWNKCKSQHLVVHFSQRPNWSQKSLCPLE